MTVPKTDMSSVTLATAKLFSECENSFVGVDVNVKDCLLGEKFERRKRVCVFCVVVG